MLKKLFLVLLGFYMISFGISLYLKCNLGADPASVLITGLMNVLKTKHYFIASIFLNIIIIIPTIFIAKKFLNIATIMSVVMVGFLVDLQMPLASIIITSHSNLYLRILIFIIATFIIGIGIAIYLFQGLGSGAIDLPPLLLTDFFPIPFKYLRILYDAILVTLGILMGSNSFGYGTLITVILLGPIIQKTLKVLKRRKQNENYS